MTGFFLLLAAVQAAAHDPLYEELREKFEKLGPVSFKVLMERIDPDGSFSELDQAEIHLRFAEAWMYATGKMGGKSQQSMLIEATERDVIGTYWGPDTDPRRVRMGASFEKYFRFPWDLGRQRDLLLGRRSTFQSWEEARRHYKPTLSIEWIPEPSDKAKFQVWLGRSDGGGVSWLSKMKKPEVRREMVKERNELILRQDGPAKVTVINLKTGFLRSQTLTFSSGVGRRLTVVELASEPDKPGPKLPENFRERIFPFETGTEQTINSLHQAVHELFGSLIENWETVGKPDRADALENLFGSYAAMGEDLLWDRGRLKVASHLVQTTLKSGYTREQLLEYIDKAAATCEQVFRQRKEEQDGEMLKSLQGQCDHLIELIQKRSNESPASAEACRALQERVRNGFERHFKERRAPKGPTPDYKALLLYALDEIEKTP
jgi:hypothetical protein